MKTQKLRLQYRYSKFWLIFWFLIFFPVALILLATGTYVKTKDRTYTLEYEGSRFWLCFWTIVFFPIAFLLLILNGCALVIEEATAFDYPSYLNDHKETKEM